MRFFLVIRGSAVFFFFFSGEGRSTSIRAAMSLPRAAVDGNADRPGLRNNRADPELGTLRHGPKIDRNAKSNFDAAVRFSLPLRLLLRDIR